MNKIVLLSFVLFAFFPFSTARGEDLKSVFDRVQNSVVLIQAQEAGVVVSSESANGLLHGVGVYLANARRVITSAELVQVSDWLEVGFEGARTISARIQSSTVLADVAVLELEELPLKISGVVLADSDKVNVGDAVFVVTCASSTQRRMLTGKILGRRVPGKVHADLVQDEFFEIDVPITTSDSGAPVFNAEGNVVGIISHTMSDASGYAGLGFAVPSNLTKDLVKGHSFWSGVSGQLLTGDLAKKFDLPQGRALLVERVAHDSLSEKFGLRGGTRTVVLNGKTLVVGGDILLNVDGISFADEDSLPRIAKRLRTLVPGQRFFVEFIRDGKREKIFSAFNR